MENVLKFSNYNVLGIREPREQWNQSCLEIEFVLQNYSSVFDYIYHTNTPFSIEKPTFGSSNRKKNLAFLQQIFPQATHNSCRIKFGTIEQHVKCQCATIAQVWIFHRKQIDIWKSRALCICITDPRNISYLSNANSFAHHHAVVSFAGNTIGPVR